MFAVEVYAAVRRFVFIEGNSRREAARVFGLSRETVLKMCQFSLLPGDVTPSFPPAGIRAGGLFEGPRFRIRALCEPPAFICRG